MKKSLSLIAVLSVLVLTGCGNEDKLTCSKTKDFSGDTLNTEYVTVFKDDYATKTEEKIVAECEEATTAESFAKQYEGKEGYTVKVDGTKVTISHTSTVAEENKKSDENKKSQVRTYYENQGYTCK